MLFQEHVLMREAAFKQNGKERCLRNLHIYDRLRTLITTQFRMNHTSDVSRKRYTTVQGISFCVVNWLHTLVCWPGSITKSSTLCDQCSDLEELTSSSEEDEYDAEEWRSINEIRFFGDLLRISRAKWYGVPSSVMVIIRCSKIVKN